MARSILRLKVSSGEKSRLAVNSLVVNAATVFDKGVFFVITVLVARYLSLEHYGEYATALSYAAFFSLFTDIGINQAMLRSLSLDRELEREHFTSAVAVKALLSLVVYGLMALSLSFTGYNADTVCLTLVLGFVRVGNVYLSSFYTLFDAKGRFYYSAVLNSTFSLAFLAGTAAVIVWKGDYFHIAGVRAGIVFLYLAGVAALTFMNYSIRFDRSTLKDFIRQALPFSVISIYSNLFQNSNVLILSFIQGTLQAGIFNNGYIFLSSLFFIPGNLNRVLLPYLYKIDRAREREKFQFAHDLYARAYGVMAFFISIALFLFSGDIVRQVFGAKFDGASPVLRVAALGVPFVFTVSGAVVTALDLQKKTVPWYRFAAFFNLAACGALSYFFGAEGAAASIVITHGILFFGFQFLLHRGGHIDFNKTGFVYLKLVVIAALTVGLYYWLMRDWFFVWSFLAAGAAYCLQVIVLLVSRDDLRILKETVGAKWG